MSKTDKLSSRQSQRIGVRERLLLAFFGISAFAVLAAVAGMMSLIVVGGVLDRITQQRTPSALASLEFSRQAERIVSAAPALLASQTPDQHKHRSQEILTEAERLDSLLSDLTGSTIDARAFEELKAAAARLRENLKKLDIVVAENLTLGEKKKALIQKAGSANKAIQRLMTPWVKVTESRVKHLRGLSDDARLSQDDRTKMLLELVAANDLREDLQQAQLEASLINDMLLQAAALEAADGLKVIEFRLHHKIRAVESIVSGFEEKLQTLMSVQLSAFDNLAKGVGSISDLRRQELDQARVGQGLLRENHELADRLTLALDNLVDSAKGDIEAASIEARSVQRLSSGVLIAVVVLSLVSSALIVWLYVGRNLVARLTALSGSMLAIADGNLQAELPPSGGDEVGRMAEALRVFRDTAVEVEEKNLRQIAEARQRLIDAIESISEGFSFYDSDDRLVLSNKRYRAMLYPGLEETVKPGTSFADTIRNAAERGLVQDANGRIEEWFAERMQRHKEPSGGFIQRRSDGSWIEVTEHKTADGGTVAIYTDITEQKQSELALLEEKRRTDEANKLVTQKNQMLESLSAKLSKYLSPQVYSSIFRGHQRVEISTKRKKVTVFFSDIAGFAETTENLESEELTGLLNHYLTEMSKIALQYGATIDKFIGDAIMLFFGDPESRGIKEDATACVKMAIAMQKRLSELQSEWLSTGLESPFQLRIGINTGYCTVGNFGSEDRMDYTIVGSEVNLASRLQAHAELGGILITHETYSLVKDVISAEEQDSVLAKGFSKPVRNYKVAGLYDDLVEKGRAIHLDQDDIKVALNLDHMSEKEKADAAKALKGILSQLET